MTDYPWDALAFIAAVIILCALYAKALDNWDRSNRSRYERERGQR